MSIHDLPNHLAISCDDYKKKHVINLVYLIYLISMFYVMLCVFRCNEIVAYIV